MKWPSSNELDGWPPPASPGRSGEFAIQRNDGHTSSNSGKKGTHAVSLANSSLDYYYYYYIILYYFSAPGSVCPAKVKSASFAERPHELL